MEDKEGRVNSFFLHQITDSHRTYICTACTLATPTHPLHYTVASDSGSEARYVRRQGHGLGIEPLYRGLVARCSQLCGGTPGLGSSFNEEEVILFVSLLSRLRPIHLYNLQNKCQELE